MEANETDTGHTKTRSPMSVREVWALPQGKSLELSLKGVFMTIKRTGVPDRENSTCFQRATHF